LEVSQQQPWNREWVTLAETSFVQENRQQNAFISVADGSLIQQGGINPGNVSLVNQTVIYEVNSNAWKTGSSYVDPISGASRQM
jgi:hypothetical protein